MGCDRGFKEAEHVKSAGVLEIGTYVLYNIKKLFLPVGVTLSGRIQSDRAFLQTEVNRE